VIYEYAVDPELVKDWALNRDVGLAPQFGMDQRRFVSDVANDWEGEVHVALLRHFEYDCTSPEYDDASKFLAALMQFLEQRTHRGAKRTQHAWIQQVLQQHQVEPFHAILASHGVEGCAEVITPAIVQDVRNQRWYLPTIDVVRKTADAMAAHLAPLLRMADQIVLVDPYFQAERPEFREVLASLLLKALHSRAPKRMRPSVVLISGVADRNDRAAIPRSEQWLNVARHKYHHAGERLGSAIPVGMEVTFMCAAEFAGGDQVHNRFLLTEVAGASIPYGTDPKGANVFDDISPLYAGQYRTRWRQYGKGDGLNVIGDPVRIQGQLR
jgi:hypothetical protein